MYYNFIKTNKKIDFYYLFRNIFILFLFFVISFLVNKINNSYFIAHGDFIQYISFNENLNNIFSTWQEGNQGTYNSLIVWAFFKLLQKALYFIGFSSSVIANIIIFLFLLGSFYSFYYSIKIVTKNISENIRFISAIIYSLNIFTFAILASSSGYTGFLFIYIFIPLILAFYEKILCEFSRFYLAIFCIIFFISIVSFSNFAFFAALLVIELLLFLSFLINFKFFNIPLIIKRFFLVLFLQFFITSFVLFPFFLNVYTSFSKLSSSLGVPNSYNLLIVTSYSIFQVIAMSMHPYNYPFLPEVKLSLGTIDANLMLHPFQNYLKYLFFGYIIILLVALSFSDKNKIRSKIFYFTAFLLIFFLLMRLTPPFDVINELIYKIPGFSLFRMPEKLFIFFPCIFLFFLIYLLQNSNLSKKTIGVSLILLLLIPLPFYTGGISKFLTNKFNSNYSYAIKIPDEYNTIRQNIFIDKSITRVIELPYSDNVLWKAYPEIFYVGHAMPYIDYSLHNKSYISSDAPDHPSLETKFSFKEYNDANIIDVQQFLDILQKFSGKYIILHKDVALQYSLEDSITYKTIEELQKESIITKLEDNNYFNIYRLEEKYVYPMLSAENYEIYFQKINPVKYKVLIPNLNEVVNLEFNQSFDPQWKLYINSVNSDFEIENQDFNYYKSTNVYENKNDEKFLEFEDITFLFKGSKFDYYHNMIEDYANSWKIDPEYIRSNFPKEYYKVNPDGSLRIEFIIYYKSQIYFEAGFVIVFLTLTVLVIFLLRKHKKVKKQLKN